jgi:hypothetical protein
MRAHPRLAVVTPDEPDPWAEVNRRVERQMPLMRWLGIGILVFGFAVVALILVLLALGVR